MIILWNNGSENLFHYSTSEIIGKHISKLYPDYLHSFLRDSIVPTLLSSGNHEYETTLVRKDGKEFSAIVSLSVLKDDAGDISGMIGYTLDITSRKQIEEALHHPISLVLPHSPKRFVGALNRGVPLLESHPGDPVSSQIEDFAFRLSKEAHQLIPPPAPGEAWNRVNKRLQLFDSRGDRNKRGLFGLGRR